ncbi:diguanylate cyclase [Thalassotalea sp. LPB0316]|uniref:GGDEF domain-containing protein n=1 Tax=Thalassotalea sp. LPB0316 TaxID=2769490 RepID=UPI001867EB95|nr:diguanylate cyclase [Thalassotalea sp. LPB0316]QOL24536.1 diguanylate cyclase [Thalassotalea sp. LPB0316]
MNSEAVEAGQLKRLQEKLNNAIASRAALEEDLSAQSSLFLQFIDKLSRVCKGMDLELDNKLANFRSLINKSEPIEVIEQHINAISILLKQQATKNEVNIRLVQEKFHEASTALQKSKGLPPQTRRQLRELISETGNGKDTLIQYMPVLSELLELYAQAINAKDTAPKQGLLNNNGSPAPAPIDQSLLEKVIESINKLSLSARYQQQLTQLKEQINNSDNTDEIINSIVNAFSLIASDLKEERDSAKSFLSSLSTTLTTVQKAVSSTLVENDENLKKHHELNSALNSKLDEISHSIDVSESLNQVKDEISHKLLSIANIIEKKVDVEQDTHQKLERKLKAMEAKVKQLDTESKTFERKLQKQIQKNFTDPLTKLGNRAAFDDAMNKALNHHAKNQANTAVVVMDLDNFKQINDTFGHTAGDKTLQVIAKTIQATIAKGAFAARYGGEEFVLIYRDIEHEHLLTELESVRAKIASLPFKFKNKKVSITVSIGATHVKQGDNVFICFERADNAMYQAKTTGKNKVVYDA